MKLKPLMALPALSILGACNAVVLHPSGDVAVQQRDLLVISVILMLLIVLPVIVLTLVVAFRYREKNTERTYEPEWDHSTKLELVVWSAPLLIIICLGAITWQGTHTLDPYRPISRLDAMRKVEPTAKPLTVEVVALDWKWLFIYPEYGIATVNQLAAPVDRPIQFKITASSVMNSFYIPALAGQIYAMPGMETKLNGVINKPGVYDGFSANYSGAGFSGMRFKFLGLNNQQFDQWVSMVKSKSATLDATSYVELAKPSENLPAMGFGSVQNGLYYRALNLCVEPGQPCIANQMAKDRMTAGETMPHAGMHQTDQQAAKTNALAIHRPITGAGLIPPYMKPKSADADAKSDRRDRMPL
ncbi:ubiquinol oxidase subunit II [Stakelama sediminis]|uniref:Ubiquinol oxidase subunit 2 n=1 Tax=Stakelama sediminis TaxID=463200 RepID=A0A840Z162_9SPHN|nr:ubiquinol oxidase subunit II [Stakelama sediminis]MBB5719470.1 cytochrome o ubiquinol oxidase subunit 2 [Stakelama sediminis]